MGLFGASGRLSLFDFCIMRGVFGVEDNVVERLDNRIHIARTQQHHDDRKSAGSDAESVALKLFLHARDHYPSERGDGETKDEKANPKPHPRLVAHSH